MSAGRWRLRRRDLGAVLVGFVLAATGAAALWVAIRSAARGDAEGAGREAAEAADRARLAEGELEQARNRLLRARLDLGMACDAKRRAEAAVRRTAAANWPKPGRVPDADWQLLSSGRWVDDDPKAAWGELDPDWRWFFEDHGGRWTRAEVWFERRGGEPDGEPLLLVQFRWGATGRAGRLYPLSGVVADGRDRFLVVAGDEPNRVRYEFRAGRLVLAGAVYHPGGHDTVLTGTYRQTEPPTEVTAAPGTSLRAADGDR